MSLSLGGTYYALPKTSIRFYNRPLKLPFRLAKLVIVRKVKITTHWIMKEGSCFSILYQALATQKNEKIFLCGFFPCGFFDVTIYQFGFFYMCLYIDTFHQTSKLTIIWICIRKHGHSVVWYLYIIHIHKYIIYIFDI